VILPNDVIRQKKGEGKSTYGMKINNGGGVLGRGGVEKEVGGGVTAIGSAVRRIS